MFLYEHAVFHSSNSNNQGIKISSIASSSSTVFTSTLKNYLEAVRTSIGRDYYNKSLGINMIVLILENDLSESDSAVKISLIIKDNPTI